MNEMRRNTMVGAFMLVGLGALAWLMTTFGELPAWLGGEEYEILMAVIEPSGIGDGAPIYLNGVQVGRVKELRFRDVNFPDRGVLIVGLIKNEFTIPNTARAFVQPAGFGLGRGQINLKVVAGVYAERLRPDEEIQGVMASPFGGMIPENLLDSVQDTVVQFGAFVEALTPVGQDLHDILDKHTIADVDHPVEARRLTANLYTVLQRFDTALKTFNDVFGDPEVKAGWQEMFANIKQMSIDGRDSLDHIRNTTAQLRSDLKRISAKLEQGVDDATTNVNEIAAAILPVLENTALLTADLSRILRGLENGQGSAGMFLKDARLYESLLLTATRLTDLIDTIQRLAYRFERQGAIGIKAQTALGPVRGNIKLSDSKAP